MPAFQHVAMLIDVALHWSCHSSGSRVTEPNSYKALLKPVLLQQELERVPSGTLSQTSTPQAQSGSAQQSAAAKAWGHLLYAFALVARHDPRARVADTAGAALLVGTERLHLVFQFNYLGGQSRPTGICQSV